VGCTANRVEASDELVTHTQRARLKEPPEPAVSALLTDVMHCAGQLPGLSRGFWLNGMGRELRVFWNGVLLLGVGRGGW